MEVKDRQIAALEKQVKQLTDALQIIGRKVEFLERENRRRGQEINQITSILRK
jgi:CII-binding regulator of phage lambda lysogenization HflD